MSGIRVAVLAGGISTERNISLITAEAVLEHLPREIFEPLRVEILADGSWSVDGGDPTAAAEGLGLLVAREVAVVFPGLHGPWGEDGRIQGFLEVAGIPFVGSGVSASAIAMDKTRARETLAAHGMPMPAALELSGVPADRAIAAIHRKLDLPVVLKIPEGGSSLEVRIARTEDELAATVEEWLAPPGGRVLAEEHVRGEEITCGVLGNASVGESPEALPPILVRPLVADSFTYEAKYDPSAVEEICPAPLDRAVLDRVEELATLAHRTLRCDGLTRSDFIVPGDGVPRFLEINTLPGLTPVSLCPKAAHVAGIPFPELLRRLVRMALDKAATDRASIGPPRNR